MNTGTFKRNIILSMLIFGSVGLFRRLLVQPSGVIALSRSVLGLFFLLLLCLFRRTKPDFAAIRRNAGRVLLSGVLLGLNWVALFEAFTYTSVAVATMCYYMAPIFVSLVCMVRGEKITLQKGLCTIAAFVGMLLVSGMLRSEISGIRGILLGLLGAVMYATIVLLNKGFREISGTDRTMAQLAASILALLPYVLLKGELTALSFAPRDLLILFTMGFVHTGLAYVLYFGAIAYVSAQTASMLSYIDPVVAVLLSVTVLAEPMGFDTMIGCVIVLAALILAEIEPKKRKMSRISQSE